MKLQNKKFLQWFVRFGKIKSQLLYFLFLITSLFLFSILLDLINWAISKETFAEAFKDNVYCYFIFFIYAAFMALHFYEDALYKLSGYERKEKKGLTPEMLERTTFLKKWDETRRAGITRYCLFDGGLIAGLLLMIPVSFVLFPKAKEEAATFPEFHDMMYFMLKCVMIGYIAGAVLYRLLWALKERRFNRFNRLVDAIGA